MKLRVDASIGLAAHATGEEMKELLARADAAMYEQKAASRRKVAEPAGNDGGAGEADCEREVMLAKLRTGSFSVPTVTEQRSHTHCRTPISNASNSGSLSVSFLIPLLSFFLPRGKVEVAFLSEN